MKVLWNAVGFVCLMAFPPLFLIGIVDSTSLMLGGVALYGVGMAWLLPRVA